MANFRCTLCGECCRGRQKVWLTPADLRRLAEHLGYPSPDELSKRAIVTEEAGEHGIPRFRLRFPLTPAGRSCRFLVNDLGEDGVLRGKCSLHGSPAKPLVCRLAPLAREVDIRTGEESWREVPPVMGCPGWNGDPPPAAGRPVDDPGLDDGIRADLDVETAYFRSLAYDRQPRLVPPNAGS